MPKEKIRIKVFNTWLEQNYYCILNNNSFQFSSSNKLYDIFSFLNLFSRFIKTLSLRGFAEAIYINWITSLSFAMTVLSWAITIKNNFAILNNNVALAHCIIQGVQPLVIRFEIKNYVNFIHKFITFCKFLIFLQ